MSNKKISQLIQSGNALQDNDWVEGEKAAGGTSLKYSGAQVREIEKGEREAADNRLKDAIGTDNSGDYRPPEGTNYLDNTTDVMDALETLDENIASAGSQSQGNEALNSSDGDGGWNITDIRVSSNDLLYNAATPTNRIIIGDEGVLIGGEDILVVDEAGNPFEAEEDAHPITKKYFDENSGSGAAISEIELTGDVTGVANEGNSWTADTTISDDAVTTSKILNENVTLAKIQQIPSQTLLANPDKNSGVPQAIGITDEFRFTTTGKLGLNAKYSYLKNSNTAQVIVDSTSPVNLIRADVGSEDFFENELSAGKTIRTTIKGTVLNTHSGSANLDINVQFYPVLSSEQGVASTSARIEGDSDGYFEISLDLIVRSGGVSGTGFVIGKWEAAYESEPSTPANGVIKSSSAFTVNTTVENRFRVLVSWEGSGSGTQELLIESVTVERI